MFLYSAYIAVVAHLFVPFPDFRRTWAVDKVTSFSHKDVRQTKEDKHLGSVLVNVPVTHLPLAEQAFDYVKRVLDSGPGLAESAVLLFVLFTQALAPASFL